MTQPQMDENDLARFLDGRMPDEERSSAVAHLSESDLDAELLADAAYLLRDLEGEGGVVVDNTPRAAHPHLDETDTGHDSRVVPLRPPSTARTWRRGPVRWLALAAVLAGVVPVALSRSRGPDGPGEFAVLLANRSAGVPAGWTGSRPWGTTRGAGDVAEENALAARIGALNVDLDLAIAARQSELTDTLAGDIAYRLENASWTGPALIAGNYREIAERAGGPPAELAALLEEARERLPDVFDADHLNLGAWAEAARIAAASRDEAFFQARASRKMMDRAASLESLDEGARATVDVIRTEARADQPDWTVLATQTGALLGQIGG